jgi:hypothetical protein
LEGGLLRQVGSPRQGDGKPARAALGMSRLRSRPVWQGSRRSALHKSA